MKLVERSSLLLTLARANSRPQASANALAALTIRIKALHRKTDDVEIVHKERFNGVTKADFLVALSNSRTSSVQRNYPFSSLHRHCTTEGGGEWENVCQEMIALFHARPLCAKRNETECI